MPREDRNVDPLSDPDVDTEAEEAESDGEEEVGAWRGERLAGEASRRPPVMPASLGLTELPGVWIAGKLGESSTPGARGQADASPHHGVGLGARDPRTCS